MGKKDLRLNFIVSAALTLAILLVAVFLGDHYFDLNDDVLMKDILSGAYTGTPAGHNIQMLYPISAFISLFYSISSALDWYGIFLCACQYLCLFGIMFRAMSIIEDKVMRITAGVVFFLFILGGMLSHLVFVQYTFTCGLLSATAAFLIMTHPGKGKKDLVLAVSLIILAYLIRSEMLLLTLPITFVGIAAKWLLHRVEIKEHYSGGVYISCYGEKRALFKRYLYLSVSIIIGLALSLVIHNIAYSRDDWKAFNALFDARTELYDFQYIPDYEGNAEFYESIGISEPEQKLLLNYNWGIDDEIGTDVLNAVAEYADRQKTDETPLPIALVQSLPAYFYRLHHVDFQKSYEYPMTDAPLNLIIGVLYLGVLVLYFWGTEKKLPAALILVSLFCCRSALWLFIIVRGRDPIRITHPLYLMEGAVLVGMLFLLNIRNRKLILAPLIASAIIAVAFIPNQTDIISREMAERDKMWEHYGALKDYFDEHSESFYFVDVYTAVTATDGEENPFSEKMFVGVDNREYNHDYMGGWASKSPLYYEKLENNGFRSMQDALLEENVYFVDKVSNDSEWIVEYYQEKGIDIELVEEDVVADVFVIYKLKEK